MREMKDSGIGWIKEIPSNWNIIRGGFLYDISTGKKDAIAEYPEGKYAFFTCSKEQKRTNEYTFDTEALLVAGNGIVGYTQYFNGKFDAYQRTYVLHNFRKINPSFLKFYVSNNLITEVTPKAQGSVIQFIKYDDLRCFNVTVPPNDEQKRIAAYLDDQCKKIDEIMAAIQNQIDTLEDYKKSVISEAVTRGLNPNAKITKSRIFYMAPYNNEWYLTKIGYCCKKLWRTFAPEDTALICTNKGKVSVRPEEMTGKMVSEDNAMQGIKKGDIAIHGMDTWHGSVAYSDYDGKITRVVHVCDSTEDKRFIVYYLQQLAFNGVYKLISNGIRGNTSDFRSWDKVADIYIALPKVDEQHQISDYLDKKCAEINSIIEDKKAQLEAIENYKKSMIYEYVTGKKEVPENE